MALILVILIQSWSGIVIATSDSTGKYKLKFDDALELILSKEIRKRELGLAWRSILNTKNKVVHRNNQ